MLLFVSYAGYGVALWMFVGVVGSMVVGIKVFS
jgi:hypothetical protein